MIKEETTMNRFMNVTAQPEYDVQFWAEMRNKATDHTVIDKAVSDVTGGYKLPAAASGKLSEAIHKESVFRQIATSIKAYSGNNHILAKDCDDIAEFVAPGDEIPGADADQDFNDFTVERHKLAVIVKLGSDFVHDASFSIEKYLISRLGRDYLQVGMYTEIKFPNADVRFIAINNGVDSDSQNDSDFTPFLNIINEWYAKDTSKKIRAVMKAKGEAGKHLTTNPPYGYIKDPNDNSKWIDVCFIRGGAESSSGKNFGA